MKMMFVLTTIKHEPNKILDDPLPRWLSCLNMSAVLHSWPCCGPTTGHVLMSSSISCHTCLYLMSHSIPPHFSPSLAWQSQPSSGGWQLRWHCAGVVLGRTQVADPGTKHLPEQGREVRGEEATVYSHFSTTKTLHMILWYRPFSLLI